MNELGILHEQATVKAFIQKERQDRCMFLLSHPSRRRDFTNQLAHFKWLDARFVRSIPPATAHTADEIVALLRRKGAGSRAWVISEWSELDAQEFDLEDVIPRIWGGEMGTIVSCIPGKLGLFRGEDMKSERLLDHP
jgi:hypothetical protein